MRMRCEVEYGIHTNRVQLRLAYEFVCEADEGHVFHHVYTISTLFRTKNLSLSLSFWPFAACSDLNEVGMESIEAVEIWSAMSDVHFIKALPFSRIFGGGNASF